MRATNFLLTTISLLGFSAGAMAQTSGAPASGDQQSTVDERAHLEDIVVTAQKREEKLQEVPITLTAITGAQLVRSGMTQTRDLTLMSPGLVVSQGSHNVQPTIRGVGARGSQPGDDGTVPIYIDGVYQSVQAANSFELSNITRIEVLKGPQGTLFGRNAVGGAINIVTRDPSNKFEGYLIGSYGRFNERKGEVYVSVPFTDNLAASVSAFVGADDGYIRDLSTNKSANPTHNETVRGKLRWNPGDNTTIKLSAFYIHNDEPTFFKAHPVGGNTAGNLAVPPVAIPGKFQTQSDFDTGFSYKAHGGSITAEQDANGFKVTALGSYQHAYSVARADSDATARRVSFTVLPGEDDVYTGEIRATSTGTGPLKWIIGAFLYKATSSYGDGLVANGTAPLFATQRSTAYAVFSEVTYDLLSNLSVTGGLRYSRETRKNVVSRTTGVLASGEKTFSDISPRASVTYELSDKARIYATYSKGFKSGVYNASSVPLNLVKPEILYAYEVGLKSEPSRQIRFNLSAFYYNYKNLQVLARIPSTILTLLQNAASANPYGAEAQLDFAVTSRLNISAGFAWTHARFKEFPNAQILVPLPNLAGNTSLVIDAAGKAIPKAPDYTASLRGDYSVPLADGKLTFASSVYYSSKFFWEFGNRLKTPAYVVVNASASWASPGDRFEVTLFMDNVTNDDRYLALSASGPSDFGVEVRPRSYGVRGRFNF